MSSTRLVVHSQQATDTQRRMHTLVVVVPDIPPQLPTELADGRKDAAVNKVGLQRVKERLDVGVLARGTTASCSGAPRSPSDACEVNGA